MQTSNYLANLLKQAAAGGAAVEFPASYFIRRYSANPTASGMGGTEVSGGGYAPVEYENIPANWQNEAGGWRSNTEIIQYDEATGSQGNSTHFALWDAASGGNMLFFAPFLDEDGDPATVAVAANQKMTFAAGALRIRAI